ncbi:MAG: 4Fe-4S binding protein [Sedimentibacter sp.]
MYIDQEKCIQCKACIPYCPMRAIAYDKDKDMVEINFDECVECGVCKYSDVCPTNALAQQEMEYPRILRSQFSNPLVSHPGTGVPGRGTEEMKTNEVTGRFKRGMVGVAIEMGRPGTGTRLYDVEKVAMALSKEGVHFEPHNPTTQLMSDTTTGKIKEEVINEKTLSAIVEFDISQDKLATVFERLKSVIPEIDTVFSLDLACRLNEDGSNPVVKVAEEAGFKVSINGKTNLGLGRPLAKEA